MGHIVLAMKGGSFNLIAYINGILTYKAARVIWMKVFYWVYIAMEIKRSRVEITRIVMVLSYFSSKKSHSKY